MTDPIAILWFGIACYALGLLSGRYALPWIVDHYPLIRRDR